MYINNVVKIGGGGSSKILRERHVPRQAVPPLPPPVVKIGGISTSNLRYAAVLETSVEGIEWLITAILVDLIAVVNILKEENNIMNKNSIKME